jgi:hypothetical protein
MALPASGTITLADIQTEFGGSNPIGLNEYYRDGAYVTANNTSVPTSGAISLQDFYGAEKLFYLIISSSVQDANISTLALNAGWDGAAPIHATINSDVYLWASGTGTYGLTIPASMPVLTVINNGKIMGCGGTGGAAFSGAGAAGGTALNVLSNVLFTNSSGAYIAGGGGGGGGGLAFTYSAGGGGGGAGGGTGGIGQYGNAGGASLAGGAGGAIGASGARGAEADNLNQGSMGGGGGGAGGGGGGFYDSSAGSGFSGDRGAGGGGGGRILSGTGGVAGIGQRTGNEWCNGGAGGSANSVGSNSGANNGAPNRGGAGGGGWGASGGSAGGSGGAAGKAINGISFVTLTNSGTIYGANV